MKYFLKINLKLDIIFIFLIVLLDICDSSYYNIDGDVTTYKNIYSHEKFDEITTNKPRYYYGKVDHGHSMKSISGSSDSLVFPQNNPGFDNSSIVGGKHKINYDPRKPASKIPLKLVRNVFHETDVIKVFEKYVSNVQFKNVDGQKYLVNTNGNPIDAGLGGINEKEENTSDKPIVKPFTGFSSLSDRNFLKKPVAMANEERIASAQAGGKVTKAALCEPELKTVELPKSSDPNIIIFPRCVRLERCGGCCGSDLLTCESLRSKPTEVQVQKFSYNDELEKLEYTGTEVIIVKSDVECRCNCKVKAADCSEKHAYSGDDCLCTCKNRGEQEICLSQSHKLWDPNLCQCICREIKACASGHSFNLETCECAITPDTKMPNREGNQRQRRSRRIHLKRL